MYLTDRNLKGVQDSSKITAHVSPPSHNLDMILLALQELPAGTEMTETEKTSIFPVTRNTLLMGVSGLTALILHKRK